MSNYTQAFVLLTALPFTKGHESLIRFAYSLPNVNYVVVIYSWNADEPLQNERFEAIQNFCFSLNAEAGFEKTVAVSEQNLHDESPDSEGFWDYWRNVYLKYGYREGNYLVGSEPYIQTLSESLWAVPVPYDIDRLISNVKATNVRNNLDERYQDMSPFMVKSLRKTYTIFGAESVGKTTTMKAVTGKYPASIGVTEFARPYLEMHGADLTPSKMKMIVDGQVAQNAVIESNDTALVVWKDTDLFSTIGYFRLNPKLGIDKKFLWQLENLAKQYASDHYYILDSNIPLEEDPLRYGGSVRESDDQFWIDLCEEFDLPYTYLMTSDADERNNYLLNESHKYLALLQEYKRKFND